MTREEAISHIKVMIESLENGIKALESNEEWEGIIPSIQPKMGRWISNKEFNIAYECYRCSKCGTYVKEQTNYCPDCGSYNGGDANVNDK